ncbi:MAG: hypothetical protein WCR42_08290 [bacterium]
MKHFWIFILIGFFNQSLFCSVIDSSSKSIFNDIDFNVSGSHISHFGLSTTEASTAVVPKYFIENNKPEWIIEADNMFSSERKIYLTDNPLQHGATYIDFNAAYQKNGFSITTDIFAEHRGFSYGVYNTDAIVFYPKFTIAYDSSFSIGNKKISVGTFAGNYTDIKLYEGLVIDNMDAQGMQAYVKYNKVKLLFNGIGDLSNWIGLNLDATLNLILSIEDIKLADRLYLNSSIGAVNYMVANDYMPGLNGINNPGYNLSLSITNSASSTTNQVSNNGGLIIWKAYTEFADRESPLNQHTVNTSAFLLGVTAKYSNNKFNIDLRTEYRSYGFAFNAGFFDPSVYYRKMVEFPDTLGVMHGYPVTDYNNTVGKNLYPLSLYNRPFSQWAVYTRYKNLEVKSIIFCANMNYKIFDFLFANADLDFNYIMAQDEPGFLYPFYTFGLGIGDKSRNYFLIGLSNKSMNLDLNYPTFYVTESPNFVINFGFNLGNQRKIN